jgi:hypothetical protein
MDKNKTMVGRRALLEAAARFRMEAARTGDARSETSSEWIAFGVMRGTTAWAWRRTCAA